MKRFQEIQRFDQWWIKALLIIVIIATLLPIISIVQQTNTGPEDIIAASVGFITVLAVSVFIFSLQLKTTINSRGIEYQFKPFQKKTIPWKEITECYVRTYNPLREYGGWGLRWGLSGKALNIKGNKGIQIVLKDNKKILLGTQKENEAKNVIETYFTINNSTP
ncbi:hypothetical protein [Planktosalinus lacus]|uniref:Uncharacterized protein n=1 Tax=Planktosalinus lacus TaxID=1526573 RepID=A0A8J2YBF6_9FLAO|nr:hypothetical protein [Planktosalinus lacus]GGD98903.1 hypothetical protein GCM10011312_22990 [Planktosalinus lacus]